jgi:hypothetical protein
MEAAQELRHTTPHTPQRLVTRAWGAVGHASLQASEAVTRCDACDASGGS